MRIPRFRDEDRIRYVASYVLLAALGCLVTGLTFLLFSAGTLRQTLDTDYNNRMTLAQEDMARQLCSMDDIEMQVKCTLCYVPSYKDSAYMHKRELISSLGRFADYLPYDFDCCLVYRSADEVYTPVFKCTWTQLVSLSFDAQDEGAFTEAGLSASEVRVIRENGALYIFRPFTLFSGSGQDDVCLIFRIPEENLLARVSTVSGLPQASLSVRIENGALLVRAEHEDLYGGLNAFRRVCIGIWTALLLAVCAAATTGGMHYYKPIERLSKALGIGGGANVLGRIETRMIETFEENGALKADLLKKLEKIDKQTETIRMQCLSLVLTGADGAEMLPRLHIAFDHPACSVAVARLDEGKTQADIAQAMRESAGDSVYYVVPFETGNRVAVVLNTADAETAARIVQEMAKSLGEDCAVEMGDVFDSPEQIAASYAQATEKLTEKRRPGDALFLADALCEAIDKKDASAAYAAVAQMTQAMRRQNLSPSGMREAFSGIAGYLTRRLTELDASALVRATDVDRFAEEMGKLVEETCAAKGEQRDEQAIVRFIQEHAMEYSMSLDYLEANFPLCGKTIGAMVRRATGMRFREYLVSLRMEYAKSLLRNTDFPVAVIADMSGYANISYFSRSFKESTGMTPARYQEEMGEACIGRSRDGKPSHFL